jgi:RNA polymerase sigma-70 factor (ECF subfamily)
VTLPGDRLGRAPAEQGAASGADAARWATLAHRVAAGDASAEAELAALFHQRVKVFAAARLQGSDAASDIAQDTILAVIEALRAGRLHEPFNLPGFVLGTAKHLVNNHHRKSARSPEVMEDPPEQLSGDNPQWATLDDERRAVVRAALLRLNPLDRRILILTLIEGLRPREIAPIVGLKPDVVRTHKARAVKAVTDQIERLTRSGLPGHEGMRGSEP